MKLEIGAEFIAQKQIYYASKGIDGRTGQNWINRDERVVITNYDEESDEFYLDRPEWKAKYGSEEGVWWSREAFEDSSYFIAVHPSIHECNY